MNRILDESKFVRDQREIVLHAIRMIEPNFQPVYTVPQILYNNPLVSALNADVRPIESGTEAPAAASENQSSNNIFTPEEINQMLSTQIDNELKGIVNVKSICKQPLDESTHIRKKVDHLFANWRETVTNSFKRDLNSRHHERLSSGQRSLDVLPYLRTLSTEQFVDILMNEVTQLVKNARSYSVPTSQLHCELGRKVQDRYQIEMRLRNGLVKKTSDLHKVYCNELLNGTSAENARQIWQRLVYNARHSGPSLDVEDQFWPRPVTKAIGRFLYNILLRDLKINTAINHTETKHGRTIIVPIFYTLLRYRDKIVKEEIKVHPVLSR